MGQGPALMTVTGIARPSPSKIVVIPIFRPKMPVTVTVVVLIADAPSLTV
jgi:hypothetical protein